MSRVARASCFDPPHCLEKLVCFDGGDRSGTEPREQVIFQPQAFELWLSAQVTLNLANHSRATASKVLAAATFAARFSRFLYSPGSIPFASRRFASSRFSRAAARDTSG